MQVVTNGLSPAPNAHVAASVWEAAAVAFLADVHDLK